MVLKLKNILFSSYFMCIYFLIILMQHACYMRFIDNLNNVLSILSLSISFIIIFISFFSKNKSLFSYLILLFLLCGLISTYREIPNNIVYYLKIYIPIVSTCIYIDICSKKEPRRLIFSLENIFLILVFINFLTMILFPNGLYFDGNYNNNWFFLYDNMHAFMFFPALLINLIANNYRKSKMNIHTILLYTMITFCIFKSFSANTVIAYFIFLIFCFFNKKLPSKIFNSVTYLITYIVCFYGIVIYRLQYIISNLIINVFHKNLEFSGRTYIWQRTIEMISNKKILGYGSLSSEQFALIMNNSYFSHAHNTILDITFKGGYTWLIIHMLILVTVSIMLYKIKDHNLTIKSSSVLLAMYIMMILESRQEKIGLYIVLAVCYCLSFFINNKKEEEHHE